MKGKNKTMAAGVSEETTPPAPAAIRRFVLMGGFLGAGKTTAVGMFVKWLKAKGLRPGIITNDQGTGLIDTALGRSGNSSVREVTGGCFCCRAADLGTAMSEMDVEMLPDVFIAEPVGSCTDLMATVLLPLEKIYQKPLTISPMSVVIDSARLELAMADELKDKSGRRSGFTADVWYIFEKQIEEAEILVLNKIDLLKKGRIGRIEQWLKQKHPDKKIFRVSTETGEGLEEWFELLTSSQSHPVALVEMDYERYSSGEARMGWYNATLGVHSTGRPLDANRILKGLARDIQSDLESAGAETAHFKMSLTRGGGGEEESGGDMAVINAVRNGLVPKLTRTCARKFLVGELLINLRAEAEPELLETVVSRNLRKSRQDWDTVWKAQASFKPGRPSPTHRVTAFRYEVTG